MTAQLQLSVEQRETVRDMTTRSNLEEKEQNKTDPLPN